MYEPCHSRTSWIPEEANEDRKGRGVTGLPTLCVKCRYKYPYYIQCQIYIKHVVTCQGCFMIEKENILLITIHHNH